MSRQRGAECCEYREEKKRLAAKKLRKKPKKRPSDRIDDCNEDEEEIEERRECDEKRLNKPEISPKLISWMEEMMGRIKPSIEERDKYSMDQRHIPCFLEPQEARLQQVIEKSECEEEKLHMLQRGGDPRDDVKKREKKKTKKKKKGARTSSKKSREEGEKTKNDEESEDVDDQEDNEESSPKKAEQVPKNETKGDKDKPMKSEFWCSEAKKKKIIDPNERKRLEDKINCKDSICSFDSQINLAGLALTKKDMKKIAEIRRKKVNSPAGRTEKNGKVDK